MKNHLSGTGFGLTVVNLISGEGGGVSVAQVKRTARTKCHKAVNDIFLNEDELHRKRQAEAISDNNECNLWNEIDRVTPSSRLVSSS